MSDEIRVNRPSQASGGQQMPMRQDAQTQGGMAEPQGSSKTPWIILAVVVVIIVILGVLFRDKLFKGSTSPSASVKSAVYQAVFLTNGQVYFGKLSDPKEDYVTLKDIYYLQVGPQQGSAQPGQPAPQQQISLVKLGNELHGPVDEMHISRSQILFYEDLKEDGQVVKAIVTDKGTKK